MTQDISEKLAFLFLGWLLGMLSPIVVDAIRRRRENILGRSAILTELNELAGTLAIATYGAHMSLGTIDRSLLEWFKKFLECHAATPRLQAFIPKLRIQLACSDDELKTIAQGMARDDGNGTVLQYYPVPLLDARVSALWTFETSLQRQLLEIRRNVALLDDIVDRNRKYLDMTFTLAENENHKLVNKNLIQTYSLYAERAKIIVELIVKLKN